MFLGQAVKKRAMLLQIVHEDGGHSDIVSDSSELEGSQKAYL
jgi:hypothetical protein